MINRKFPPPKSDANNAGAGLTPIGATVPVSASGGASAWTPTVAHLLVILVLEIAAFAALRYAFRIVQK